MLPSQDFLFLLIELAILFGCARFAWQAYAASRELRELVELSDGLLRELREAVAAVDRTAVPPADESVVPATARSRTVELGQAALALSRLGMSKAEIAQQMAISRGEADLLLKVGESRA